MLEKTSNDQPLVSVIMTFFNRKEFLPEAVESILNQTYKNIEFIIVDDGSSDGGYEMLKSYAEKDKRIILLKNNKNRGIVYSANRGIDAAKGKYIARMDSDDIAHPDRIKKTILYLKENNLDLCGASTELFQSETNEKIKTFHNPQKHEEIKAALFFGSPVVNPTAIGKAEIFKKLKYTDGFPSAQDYELWSRAIDLYTFGNTNEVLLRYRVHEDKESGSRKGRQDKNAQRVQKYMFSKINIDLSKYPNLYKPKDRILHPVSYFKLLVELFYKNHKIKYVKNKTLFCVIAKEHKEIVKSFAIKILKKVK